MENKDLQSAVEEGKKEEMYLRPVDLKRLSEDTGLDYNAICNLVGIKNVNNLYKWQNMSMNKGGRPKYNAIVKLIEAGASVEALFGVEYAPGKNTGAVKTEDDLLNVVKKALSDLGYPEPSSLRSLLQGDASRGPSAP